MGRAFVYGDNVNTDVLAPGAYMKGPADALARHCLEAIDPHFATEVRPGDVVVAGTNFGMGSSREQAASCLKGHELVIVARGFARIFLQNAINLGLRIVTAPELEAAEGDDLELGVDYVVNRASGLRCAVVPLPRAAPTFLRLPCGVPCLKVISYWWPSRLTVATSSRDKALTTLAPTPCRPPAVL